MSVFRLARIGVAGAVAAGFVAPAALATEAPSGGGAPARGNIVGVVHDEAGRGISDVAVEVLDGDGKVVQRATSSGAGGYEIRCVAEGAYDLRLDPGTSGHRGQRVVAPVTGDGLTVDWTVAPDKPAIARARPTGGPCLADATVPPGAPAGAGGGAGAGTAAAVGLGAGAAAVTGTIGGLSASGAFESGGTATASQ